MATFLAQLWEASGQECPTDAAPFNDVADDHWAAPAIDCIHGLGITTGTTTNTYAPDDTVTRAQMATFLAQLWEAWD